MILAPTAGEILQNIGSWMMVVGLAFVALGVLLWIIGKLKQKRDR